MQHPSGLTPALYNAPPAEFLNLALLHLWYKEYLEISVLCSKAQQPHEYCWERGKRDAKIKEEHRIMTKTSLKRKKYESRCFNYNVEF